MGVVWLARAPDGGAVALKLLRAELAHDELFRRRFAREARLAAAVDHPNLVRVVDAGEAAGRAYLATRYVEGSSLAERLREAGPLPVDEALRVVGDVAAGLDALHRAGLVHRDVKPANVLLAPGGEAVLTDFGLARGPASTVLTRAGQLLGSVDYLAPELV